VTRLNFLAGQNFYGRACIRETEFLFRHNFITGIRIRLEAFRNVM